MAYVPANIGDCKEMWQFYNPINLLIVAIGKIIID